MELWPAWTILSLFFVLSLLLLYAVRTTTHRAPRSRLLRIALRVFAIFLLLCSTFLASEEASDDASTPAQPSPDGAYTVRVLYEGLLWPSSTIILLSRTGPGNKQVIYSGDGWAAGGGEGSPYIEWDDNTHLTIRIHGTADETSYCHPPQGPITLVCKTNNW